MRSLQNNKAGAGWNQAQDDLLRQLVEDAVPPEVIADQLKRTVPENSPAWRRNWFAAQVVSADFECACQLRRPDWRSGEPLMVGLDLPVRHGRAPLSSDADGAQAGSPKLGL